MEIKSAKYDLLINRHKNNIYGYALFMMKNKMDADDITQEVFIKIWQKIDQFNFLSAKAWIYRTTHNLCIDYIRKHKNAGNVFVYSDEMVSNLSADEYGRENPDNAAHINLMKDELKVAIQRLPENLRSVLILYEIQNLKYREIEKVLDMPLNTVKVNLMRARKKLRMELNKYEPQEVL